MSSSSSISHEISKVNNAAKSLYPWMQSGMDVEGLVMEQRSKFKIGDQAKSPTFPIPIDCIHPDKSLSPHNIAWIEGQLRKAEDIIFDDRFEDAIAMVTDGRAHILVSSGYNMYGKK